MMEKRSNKIIFLLIPATLLFAYTVCKAMMLSITWDEAYSYIEFARNGKIFLSSYDMMSANNHMLNTALMMLFTKLFGLSEFVMRMPVLLAHLLFLFYSARLVKHMNNKWLMTAAFIVLNVNPYMLDFFTVARGYGLSLGLMMASIYFLYRFHCDEKSKHSLYAMLFAAFAVFANFVLLNYFVVLLGVVLLLNMYFAGKKEISGKEKTAAFLKGSVLPLLVAGILLFIVVPIATGLKEAGALFFGGEKSFWSDTVSTITDRSFYEMGYNVWFQRLAKGVVFLVLISSFVFSALWIRRRTMNPNRLFLASLLLLICLSSLSTILQHHLMSTPYLLDRTALFLVVLFNLIFVFLISELSEEIKGSGLLLFVSSLFLVIHFAMCFSLNYVLEWRYDANTKEMLSDLEKIKKIPEGKETVSIGIPLIFDPAINFYRIKNDLAWLNTVWRKETTSMQHDYFCLSQKDLALFSKDSVEILKTYPGTGNVLAKVKYPPKKITTVLDSVMTFKDSRDDLFPVDENVEYSPGFSYTITDSITPERKGVFAFYADVMAPDLSSDNLVMVISFQDAKGNLYSWQKAYVKDFIKDEMTSAHATFTCIIPPEAKAGDVLKAYIWNPDKEGLYIRKMEFKWLAYHY